MQIRLLIPFALVFVGCKPPSVSDEASIVFQERDLSACCLKKSFKVNKTVEPKHMNPAGELWNSNNLTKNCSLVGQTQRVEANTVYSIVDQKEYLRFNDKGGASLGSVLFKLYTANGRLAGKKAEVSLYCSFTGVGTTYDVRQVANKQLSHLFVRSK